MLTKRISTVAIMLLLLTIVGCARTQVINIDGMPISNHEYQLTNEETGIRTVFVLVKYYREYEDKDYIVKPEYLDALQENRINSGDVERLGLHVKVVNLSKRKYDITWNIREPSGRHSSGLIYHGKISRKDFYLPLPFEKDGVYDYLFTIRNVDGENMYDLPPMRYKVKGGEATQLPKDSQ
ncbi:MAG TPA: hypothetical protein VMV58_04470 [Desulfosporosinus sp.]|nr:hypothetical protein [Desulfosporosinus sp.]